MCCCTCDIIVLISLDHISLSLYCCRTFTHPSPPERLLLDAAASISSAVLSSLKLGTIRRCSFSVCIRRDVFNYMFGSSGVRVPRKPGKMFCRSDFSDLYFSDDDFVFHSNSRESVRVVFPVYMYSHVKNVKLCCNRCDFSENVCINLLKEHC